MRTRKNRAWAIDRVSQTDAANWVPYTPNDWARRVTVRNETVSPATNRVRVGDPAMTGPFSSANDDYHDLGPGESVTILVSGDAPVVVGDVLVSVDTNPTVVSFLQEAGR